MIRKTARDIPIVIMRQSQHTFTTAAAAIQIARKAIKKSKFAIKPAGYFLNPSVDLLRKVAMRPATYFLNHTLILLNNDLCSGGFSPLGDFSGWERFEPKVLQKCFA